MTNFGILETLARVGAIIVNSHIVYTSGKHGDSYVNKDAVYPHTDITSQLCEQIAQHFAKSNVDVVIAPAIGGVILSQWTAHHLSRICGKEVQSVYAEKAMDSDEFIIKRGYDKIIAGKRTLVLEDVLNTGGSVQKVIVSARALGADLVGVGALCNRGDLSAQKLDVPELFALVKVSLGAWDPEDCPLCQKHVPINTEVGKGRDFLAKQGST